MFYKKQKIVAVVPAAGVGIRMNTDCPKQYLLVAGKTIIEHTIYALLLYSKIQYIVVVLNSKDNFFCNLNLIKNPRVITVIGAKERSGSVLAGLNFFLRQYKFYDYWVLVHDAVRPCLHQDDLNKITKIIKNNNCCGGILVSPIRDTIKSIMKYDKFIHHTVDRSTLWNALTPQFFPLLLLRNCLSNALKNNVVISDESSVLEHYGYKPMFIIGRADNIKVTFPEDLSLIEFYLSRVM
ncbi:2-C-methyl-D-erythritol 4-phosphate cytidylyltransferase [Candidatus Providencia siddallii]|uniref:2-C-methyl-D-erythritol 4-phosphate cytidylyltransferase n=1 Tax=Candidatus Providencia siddallii TaxID=1715285 RepID=A0A0M6W9D5_9GAMM|nr:2-C-methyl-D-erythritol 4-phosphate cytidylyltransferase [Candidatus Providencia siddallii]